MNEYTRQTKEIKTPSVSVCQHLSALVVLALSVSALPAHSGEYDKMAAQISRAAVAHGRKRLAVLPFQGIGKEASSGRVVSERLVGPLMGAGGVEVVERTLLEAVMREQRLQFSGVVDSRSMKELGKILDVDAIVTGTVMALRDDRVEINARLIDAETARVLSVGAIKVEKDWSESFMDDIWGPPAPPLPSMDLAVPAAAAEWPARESLSDDGGCGNAEQAVDALERSLVDLKARYWAQKLREGLNIRSLSKNPGSEIRNSGVRSEFYSRLKARVGEGHGSDLTQDELAVMSRSMKRIERLSECR